MQWRLKGAVETENHLQNAKSVEVQGGLMSPVSNFMTISFNF
jgi:hypothetical protein